MDGASAVLGAAIVAVVNAAGLIYTISYKISKLEAKVCELKDRVKALEQRISRIEDIMMEV